MKLLSYARQKLCGLCMLCFFVVKKHHGNFDYQRTSCSNFVALFPLCYALGPLLIF